MPRVCLYLCAHVWYVCGVHVLVCVHLCLGCVCLRVVYVHGVVYVYVCGVL